MNFNKIIILILLFISCKNETFDDNTRMESKVMILGHSGMGIAFSWPINSFYSVKTCLDIGCDGSEIDVQMTADSVLVAYHNNELESQTNCSGKIFEKNWVEIKNCIYNRSINKVKLNSLDEIFSSIDNIQNYYFSLDIKFNKATDSNYEKAFLRAIKNICAKYNIEKSVLLESNKNTLNMAREMGLKNPLFLFSNGDDLPYLIAQQNNFFGISTNKSYSLSDLKTTNNLGLRTMLWSPANFNENKELLAKKPDIIQTDDPISLLKILNRFNYENVTP